MRIKGSRNEWFIGGIIIIMLILCFVSQVGIWTIALCAGWFIYYVTVIWIKEIEIKDNEIEIKRLGRSIKIYTYNISDIALKRNSIIIFKGQYAAINIFKYQINKEDRTRLIEYLEQYKERI